MAHPTVAERRARGRAARSALPRSAHARLGPDDGRPDPVSLLERQAADRVPELVPIRHGRMLESPFAFFRGAALIMASDLGGLPRSGLRVQLCGDAHLSNFGLFGTPERRLVFDLNDFDETLPGPFEWDVKRLAASLEVAGRARGFSRTRREAIVSRAVGRYRRAMTDFAGLPALEVFYAGLDADEALRQARDRLSRPARARAARNLAKARTRDSLKALATMTREVGGEPRIVGDPPLIVPVRDLLPAERAEAFAGWAHDRLREYRRTLAADRRLLLERYRFVDLARKVVGVGSVGTRAWVVLLLGRDDRDPLFLQLKEAQASVLEAFAGRSRHRNRAHRVVTGQRLMQAAGDAFLGWMRVIGFDGVERDFYVRQLRDWKGSADTGTMTASTMGAYGEMCGWTLARAHARSGDPVAIASYLGPGDRFDRALVAFGAAYADRNEADHAALAAAVGTGRLEARTGV